MPWVSLTTTCVDAVISMVNSITKASASTMICGKATILACIYPMPVSKHPTTHPPGPQLSLVRSSLRSSRERSNPQLETIPGSPSLLRVAKLPLLGLKLSTTTSSPQSAGRFGHAYRGSGQYQHAEARCRIWTSRTQHLVVFGEKLHVSLQGA